MPGGSRLFCALPRLARALAELHRELSRDASALNKTPEHIELEERIVFQEHALDKLNRVVAEQQLELDALQRDVRELRRTARAAGDAKEAESRTLEDDRPPHY